MDLQKGDRVTIEVTGTVVRNLKKGFFVLKTDRNNYMTSFDPNYMNITNIEKEGK